MVYHGTFVSEKIAFHPAGEPTKVHFIEMTKAANETLFWVSCCCGEEDWVYEFDMECPSDYERVKYCIMDTMFMCESFDGLLDELEEVFEDGFECTFIGNEECNDCDKHLN